MTSEPDDLVTEVPQPTDWDVPLPLEYDSRPTLILYAEEVQS